MNKKGTCVSCGRENMTITAKGECWACYDWHKKGKRGVPPACEHDSDPDPYDVVVSRKELVDDTQESLPIAGETQRPKGFEAIMLRTPDNLLALDDDVFQAMQAAEVTAEHVNALLRIHLANSRWL